jgi:hypothetical protein
MHFKWLSGDVDYRTYGGKWISKPLSAGLFNYWLVMELMNLEDLGCRVEGDGVYNLSLSAVSLDLLPSSKLVEVVDDLGQDWFTEHFQKLEEKIQLEIMIDEAHTYGYGSILWSEDGNNYTKLLKEAHRRAIHIAKYPWSYMEQQANQIGATHLDFMRGNVLGPMAHTREEDRETPAGGFGIQNLLMIIQK